MFPAFSRFLSTVVFPVHFSSYNLALSPVFCLKLFPAFSLFLVFSRFPVFSCVFCPLFPVFSRFLPSVFFLSSVCFLYSVVFSVLCFLSSVVSCLQSFSCIQSVSCLQLCFLFVLPVTPRPCLLWNREPLTSLHSSRTTSRSARLCELSRRPWPQRVKRSRSWYIVTSEQTIVWLLFVFYLKKERKKGTYLFPKVGR